MSEAGNFDALQEAHERGVRHTNYLAAQTAYDQLKAMNVTINWQSGNIPNVSALLFDIQRYLVPMADDGNTVQTMTHGHTIVKACPRTLDTSLSDDHAVLQRISDNARAAYIGIIHSALDELDCVEQATAPQSNGTLQSVFKRIDNPSQTEHEQTVLYAALKANLDALGLDSNTLCQDDQAIQEMRSAIQVAIDQLAPPLAFDPAHWHPSNHIVKPQHEGPVRACRANKAPPHSMPANSTTTNGFTTLIPPQTGAHDTPAGTGANATHTGFTTQR